MTGRCPIYLAAMLLFLGFLSTRAAADLEQQIAQARELAASSSWQESQLVIDQLLPRLGEASPDQRAKVWILQARNLALAGEEAAGLAILESLIPIELPRLDVERRLRIFNLASNIALSMEDFERSFYLLGQAMALHTAEVNAVQRADTFSLASFFHSQVGEIERALDYAERAVELARQVDDPREICAALQRLGVAQGAAGDEASQLVALNEALEVCHGADFPLFLASVQLGLGGLFREAGDLDQAAEYIEQGLAGMEAIDYRVGILTANFELARLRYEQGKLEEAQIMLEALVEPYSELGHWADLVDIHRKLADIAAENGALAKSISHYDARLEARERHLDEQRSRRLTYLQAEFDAQRKQQEIALLEERNQVMLLEAEAQARQRWLYVILTLALASIGCLLLLMLIRARADRYRFQHLSETDGLTGLCNHTRFFELVQQGMAEARQQGQPAHLAFADIDHFKQFNDRYGHDVGDKVLRQVGERIRKHFSGVDAVLGRVGGEEFGVFLVGQPLTEAVELLEAFRQQPGVVRFEDKMLQITFSVGVASLCADERPSVLRRRADQALYQAKVSSRNCLVIAGDDER